MDLKVRPQVYLDSKGDVEKEKHLIGFALNQRNILNNLMSFNSLQQDRRKVLLADGSIIEVQSCFGIDKVFISSPKVVIPVVDEVKPRYAAYVVATGMSGLDEWAAAFAWDIVNNDYATISDNTFHRTTETETYYLNGDGEKVVTGPGYPRVWNVSQGNIFSLWQQVSFEGMDGEILSVENIGTTQIVEVDFYTHAGKAVKFNYYSPPGVADDGLSTRYYGINGFVTTDDYVVNTGVTGPFLYAKVLAVLDDTRLLIDTQIFGLYPGNADEIVITPFLPLFHVNQAEHWAPYNYADYTTYTPDNDFARYVKLDYSVAPDVISTVAIGDGSLGGYVGGDWNLINNYPQSSYWQLSIYSPPITVNNTNKYTCSINTGNTAIIITENFSTEYDGVTTGYNNGFMGSVDVLPTSGTSDGFSITALFSPWISPGGMDLALFNEHCIIQIFNTTNSNTPDVKAQTQLFNDPFILERMPTTNRSTKLENAIESLATALRAVNDSRDVQVSVRVYRR